MKLGIVGLPNVGKSTLFNSMTLGKAEAANYPFCTIDPNVGVVPVPDERLARLTEMYDSAKTTPAVIEFVDIAGLVRGASKGEGLGNKFLSHIREVDAICHVVRCFEDTNVVHVDGSIDPIRDIETINLELIFSDIEILERRISKTVKLAKQDKSLQRELDILLKLKEALEAGKSARSVEFDAPEDYEFVQTLTLLTAKPVLMPQTSQRMTWRMTVHPTNLSAESENMPPQSITRYSCCAQKSKKKSPIWTKQIKRNFLPSWAWKPVVWIA